MAAARGRAGGRAALLPALALLLGLQIPTPLQNEIVWHLQLSTASWAGWLLDTSGQEFFQGGVILSNEAHTFQVIDGCSGLNGIEILTLVALIIRELFKDAGWRQWLLVALAPGLGFALNVVRIAYIAVSPDPQALAGPQGDHTSQGLAVLVVGTGLLYALGWAMARTATPGRASVASAPPERTVRALPWRLAAAGLSGLGLLSLALPGFEPPSPGSNFTGVDFPAQQSGWTSESAPADPLFLGLIGGGVSRRYKSEHAPGLPPEIVDLLVGFEVASFPDTSFLLSSKFALPDPDWDLEHKRRIHLWQLDREVDLALASRGPGDEYAMIYIWQVRDGGLLRESWRSFLALEASPFRRAGRRAVVRLVAYAPHDGQLVLDRAKQRLDRFVMEFRKELVAL